MEPLKFTKSHEWLKLEAAKECTVGITEHAQSLLGDMVYIELVEPGKVVQAGDSIGVLESVKAASDIYAPISGTIRQVNQEAQANPSVVNTDPYGAGWLVKIEPIDAQELSTLLSNEEYQQSLSEH